MTVQSSHAQQAQLRANLTRPGAFPANGACAASAAVWTPLDRLGALMPCCDDLHCSSHGTMSMCCAAPGGTEVDGLLVADDALATSEVTGAVAVVPLRRAADLLKRLGGDELLRRQVAAVLVLEGEGGGLQGGLLQCSAGAVLQAVRCDAALHSSSCTITFCAIHTSTNMGCSVQQLIAETCNPEVTVFPADRRRRPVILQR